MPARTKPTASSAITPVSGTGSPASDAAPLWSRRPSAWWTSALPCSPASPGTAGPALCDLCSPKTLQQAGPVMGSTAGLNANHRRRQLLKESDEILAPEFLTQDWLLSGIHPMKLKDVF